MKRENYQFASPFDGLKLDVIYKKADNSKALVVIAHGMAEHKERYEELTDFLALHAYDTLIYDHRGHGESILKSDDLGYFYDETAKGIVEDLSAILKSIKSIDPAKPLYLLGHSMGSFLLRTVLIRHPEMQLAGAVIAGTGWQPEAVLRLGQLICRQQAKSWGAQGVSPLINRLMFGTYNRGLEDAQSRYAWLSRDRQTVQAYEKDPLCGFDCTIGLAGDLLYGLRFIQNPKNLRQMRSNLPVLFVAGDRDPVGNRGRGVQRAYQAFQAAGMKNVTLRLYPAARHELHNEENKEEFYQDVFAWIQEKM